MTRAHFLPSVAPSLESLQLASLVPNIRQPDQDALSCLPVEKGRDFLVYEQENLGKFLEVTKSAEFKSNVSRILSAAFGTLEGDMHLLGPCQVRYYQLTKPKKLFKDLCKLKETREWLEEEIEAGTRVLYYIVGYYTAINAKTNRMTQQSSQASFNVQVPVGDIVSGGATSLAAGIVNLDLGASVGTGSGHTTEDAARIKGERIFAFSYRKVTFSFFALRDKASTAKLKPDNCWSLTSDNRGDDEEDAEGVEVQLGEAGDAEEEGFALPTFEDEEPDEA
jgi:hypothetical protein